MGEKKACTLYSYSILCKKAACIADFLSATANEQEKRVLCAGSFL